MEHSEGSINATLKTVNEFIKLINDNEVEEVMRHANKIIALNDQAITTNSHKNKIVETIMFSLQTMIQITKPKSVELEKKQLKLCDCKITSKPEENQELQDQLEKEKELFMQQGTTTKLNLKDEWDKFFLKQEDLITEIEKDTTLDEEQKQNLFSQLQIVQ